MNEAHHRKEQSDLFHAMAGIPTLIKYDCPTPNCHVWCVTFEYARFQCVGCERELIASQI